MLDVGEAIGRVVSNVNVATETEFIPLHTSVHRIAAPTYRAPSPIPSRRTSVKDGFAFKYPVRLNVVYTVVGSCFAGHGCNDLSIGEFECVRVATGSVLPEGMDTVVQKEEVEETALTLTVKIGPIKQGLDVREIGSDIKTGTILLKRGETIEPAHVALLASYGVHEVHVFRQLKIAILSTGDELTLNDPSSLLHVHDTNRPMLLASLSKFGSVMDLGLVSDATGIKSSKWFDDILSDTSIDILVTSGAVSVGDRDFVRETLKKFGDFLIDRLYMKPGKPCLVTKVTRDEDASSLMVFGLPGNPVSAFVTCELLVKPALRQMAGSSHPWPSRISCQLGHDFVLDSGRPEFHRAMIHSNEHGVLIASSSGFQRSSALMSMRGAQVLLELPSGNDFGKPVISKGTICKAIPFGETCFNIQSVPWKVPFVLHVVLSSGMPLPNIDMKVELHECSDLNRLESIVTSISPAVVLVLLDDTSELCKTCTRAIGVEEALRGINVMGMTWEDKVYGISSSYLLVPPFVDSYLLDKVEFLHQLILKK